MFPEEILYKKKLQRNMNCVDSVCIGYKARVSKIIQLNFYQWKQQHTVVFTLMFFLEKFGNKIIAVGNRWINLIKSLWTRKYSMELSYIP